MCAQNYPTVNVFDLLVLFDKFNLEGCLRYLSSSSSHRFINARPDRLDEMMDPPWKKDVNTTHTTQQQCQ